MIGTGFPTTPTNCRVSDRWDVELVDVVVVVGVVVNVTSGRWDVELVGVVVVVGVVVNVSRTRFPAMPTNIRASDRQDVELVGVVVVVRLSAVL